MKREFKQTLIQVERTVVIFGIAEVAFHDR